MSLSRKWRFGAGARARIRRRIATYAVDWLIGNPGILPSRKLRRWTQTVFDNDRDRQIVVHELKELIKEGAPAVENFSTDMREPGGSEKPIGFEHLAGLFASTTLNEFIITMNLRQSAYLFELIRRHDAPRVIEVGRHWGGTTVLIAAAMSGRGDFWSIADPRELDWDLEFRGRDLPRPIEAQLEDLLPRLGLSAHIIAGDPLEVDVETGEVDIVHIDGEHTYEAAMGNFDKFGMRVGVGGAVLFDDAVADPFCDSPHTAEVKRVVAEVASRGDFRVVREVQRLIHFERTK